jgi:hypothetical protein
MTSVSPFQVGGMVTQLLIVKSFTAVLGSGRCRAGHFGQLQNERDVTPIVRNGRSASNAKAHAENDLAALAPNGSDSCLKSQPTEGNRSLKLRRPVSGDTIPLQRFWDP